MFIKTVKYDFLFSKNMFFGMGFGAIALALILRFTALAFGDGFPEAFIGFVMLLVLIIGGIACIWQIAAFFDKNFFDETGYLMLTLPVGRFTLLASKLLVAFVWFNFMLAAGAVVLYIIAFSQIGSFSFSSVWASINASNISALLQLNVLAMFFVSTVYLTATLNNSIIGRWRVHGAVALGTGAAYTALFFWLSDLISKWNVGEQIVEEEWLHRIYNEYGEYMYSRLEQGIRFYYNRPLVGVRYGRIPIGDAGNHIDLYMWGMALVLSIIAVAVTHYLLKRRTNLR